MIEKKTLREAQIKIGEAKTFIETVRDVAQEKFDEKSDKWKEGDAASAMEDQINTLGELVDNLDDASNTLDEIIGN